MKTERTLICLRRVLVILCGFFVISRSVPAAGASPDIDPEELYIENALGFVDASMDVSGGIPEDAIGRLAEIWERGELIVATEPYYAPQEFIDPEKEGQEQYVGADMELARRIADRMGVSLTIVPMDFSDVLTAPVEGKCDLAISGLAFTPGRAAAMALSKGYHYSEEEASTGIIIREDDIKTLQTIADLADKTIIAQSGSLQELLMSEHVLSYHEFRRVPSMADVYEALTDRSADAGAADIETALVYIENNPDCGLVLMDNIRMQLDEEYAGDRIAGPKGENQLLYFVNGVIDEVLASGEYSEWFAQYAEYAGRLGL